MLVLSWAGFNRSGERSGAEPARRWCELAGERVSRGPDRTRQPIADRIGQTYNPATFEICFKVLSRAAHASATRLDPLDTRVRLPPGPAWPGLSSAGSRVGRAESFAERSRTFVVLFGIRGGGCDSSGD